MLAFKTFSNKLTFGLLTLKVVSESRVTCSTPVPIFSLPRPLCSRVRPDVRDRQTDRRQTKASLNEIPLPYGAEA